MTQYVSVNEIYELYGCKPSVGIGYLNKHGLTPPDMIIQRLGHKYKGPMHFWEREKIIAWIAEVKLKKNSRRKAVKETCIEGMDKNLAHKFIAGIYDHPAKQVSHLKQLSKARSKMAVTKNVKSPKHFSVID